MEKIEDYDYQLPRDLIAQRPVEPRTNSRLMILKNNDIFHKRFNDILDYFSCGDVLVLNETRVLKVKLKGCKESGGRIELMLDGINDEAVIKGRVKQGTKIIFEKGIFGVIKEKNENKIKIKFNKPIKKVVELIGRLPTPPYIKKELKKDSEYQTVFAKKNGSLACPTAGLHFDNDLINKIKEKGVTIAKVCLHVSWDTFLPINVSDFKEHKMHGEYCEIDKENVEIINNAKRLFVVGTTALRALESLSKEDGKVGKGEKTTNIFIYPGYKFNLKYAGLVTNFHLPKSTLLLMISAFLDKETIFKAYNEAVKKKYRFFSLGDAMFILK